jgi:hypothetical protein
MKWYYLKEGSRVGPLSASAIEDLKQCGAIDSATLVASEKDQENWIPVNEALSHDQEVAPKTNLFPLKWDSILSNVLTWIKNGCFRVLKSR